MVLLAYSVPSAWNDNGTTGVAALVSFLAGLISDSTTAVAGSSSVAAQAAYVPTQFLVASVGAAVGVTVTVFTHVLSRIA